MDDEPIFVGKTAYFSGERIPPKYREELDLIFDNVKKIKGEKFVQHVKFVVNLKSLTGMILANSKLNSGIDEDKFIGIITHIAHQLTCSHAQACELTPELDKEAFKLTETMDNVVSALQDEINHKKRGQS